MTDHSPSYQRATRLTTSRRVKQEEKQALRQTLLFGLAGVAFLLISIFVIVPGVIRLIGSFSQLPTEAAEQLPPQVPQFSVPPTATASASYTLTGFTTPQAKVYIIQNGSEVTNVTADDSGSFAVPLTFVEGENTLAAYAKNGTQESAVSQEYTTIFDNQPPQIEITEPTENQSIQGKRNQNLTVKGKTKPGSRLFLNDRLVFLQPDGAFSTTHRLENGTNTLAFRVIDQAGNQAEKSLTLSFQE